MIFLPIGFPDPLALRRRGHHRGNGSHRHQRGRFQADGAEPAGGAIQAHGPPGKHPVKESKGEAKPESKRDEACRGCNALVVQDQNGFPAPRPGNPVFLPGAGFSATIAVNGRNRATVLNEPMPKIAEFLGNTIGSPVEDRTGLTGTYDIHLEYVPNSPHATDAAADPGTGIFDAIPSQLGLKLTPTKVPVETLVIDHAEKVPTEN